eukprot:CAMPEP_0175902928 /NCGR_PEP_ID=MMETSP0108-20121206/3653_1 /TAXON_ID=195067 ORGANISM="Goniomonas pacifica, Strain CCMP1869" /NCGR_SAMPLE_ID=MMETSP0108 /ASSEMBLY_ACC=CAM_ASM_000204 /LENGTH=82 /DNA_ID=CAMNT_0017224603 /DNA_START=5 /DNA_END=253 /DNA_ORIENTATION=+
MAIWRAVESVQWDDETEANAATRRAERPRFSMLHADVEELLLCDHLMIRGGTVSGRWKIRKAGRACGIQLLEPHGASCMPVM